MPLYTQAGKHMKTRDAFSWLQGKGNRWNMLRRGRLLSRTVIHYFRGNIILKNEEYKI